MASENPVQSVAKVPVLTISLTQDFQKAALPELPVRIWLVDAEVPSHQQGHALLGQTSRIIWVIPYTRVAHGQKHMCKDIELSKQGPYRDKGKLPS